MSKKQKICLIISIVTMVLIVALVIYRPTKTMDVVILGDSNIGNFRDETGVTYVVENELDGENVFNGGFGGSTAVNVNEVSFINLAKAIESGEFSRELSMTAARDDGDLTYYDDALRDLSYIDFKKVKVLVVAYGTNDQLIGASVDEYTSAVKEGIDRVHRKYPELKIIVVTPFYNEGQRIDKGQPEVKEYGQALINTLKDENVIIIDGYNSGIVTEDNIKESTLDGVHLSIDARKQYGTMLGQLIKKEM